MRLHIFATCLLLVQLTTALYRDNGPVVKLTASNFKKLVLDDKDSLWLVEFYAPWCGHCKQLAPSYEVAAKQLKGVVKLGAVDMDEEQSVGAPYNIQGFPTIKWFGFDKQNPKDYSGARDADGMRKFSLSQVSKEVNARMNKKSKAGSSDDAKASGSEKKQKTFDPQNDKDVVILTDSNFEATVYGSKDIWMVEFYAPWCGHCKSLEPEWNQAASQMKGKVRFAKVDATVETQIAQKFGVKGYPTIKYFGYGDKSQASAKDYPGSRDLSGITSFVNDLLDKADIPPTIHELNKQNVFDNNCQGSIICVVAFLPNIYESTVAERTAYLDTLLLVAKSQRKNPFVFFWLQAGDQLDLERALNLGFGYPAVIAVSPNKNVYATMRGAYNRENTNSFLTSVMTGSQSVAQLPTGGLAVKKVSKWDGKEAPVIEEEPLDAYDEL